MNTGDPCPKCGKSTWSYDEWVLTCKDGHHTSVDEPRVEVARPKQRPWPAIAGASFVAGAYLPVIVHHL